MRTDLPFVMKKEDLQYESNSHNASFMQHCGFCQHVCLHPEEPMGLGHCLNKKKVDDLNKYLTYMLCKTSPKVANMDFLPTIVLDEEYELGCKTINHSDYANPWDVLSTVWDNYNCFLISGETGIGKTIFMTKIVKDLCLSSIRGEQKQIIPIYIDCSEVPGTVYNLQDWIVEKMNSDFPNLDFKQVMISQNNVTAIFLDSFNSIGNNCTDEREFRTKVNSLVKNLSDLTLGNPFVKFIVSSENVSYLVGTDSCFKKSFDLAQLYLQPLTTPQVDRMIDLSNASEENKQRLRFFVASNGDLPFLKLPFFVDRLIKSVKTIGDFSSKASFVSYYVDWSTADSTQNKEKICNFLCNIAFILSKKSHVSIDEIEREYKELNARDVVDLLEYSVNKLFLTRNSGKFTFSHKTFFDYFLALYIKQSKLYPCDKLDRILLCDMRFQNNEVLTYLYDIVDNQEEFLNWLLREDVLYAAECVVNGHSSDEHRDMVVATLIQELSEGSNKYADSDKREMGVLLGLLGDVRISLEQNPEYILPKVSSSRLKSGVRVGVYPVTNAEYSCFLKDPHHLDPEFWTEAINDGWFSSDAIFVSVFSHWKMVQVHLRENPEYVENLCGYQNFDKKQCASLFYFLNLTEDNLENMIRELYDHNLPVPIMWENPEYNNPSMPVVGVSVYEAIAYCRWLSKKSNCTYRLLSNSEWEEAANSTFRRYAYGNRPNYRLMNTIESSWGGILPVGIISENKTREGLFDITGNLFEWTSSCYPLGAVHSGLDTQYICKGGSWVQDASRAVSTYIGRGKCWVKNIDLGFRVCRYD